MKIFLNPTIYFRISILFSTFLFTFPCSAQDYSPEDFIKIPASYPKNKKWIDHYDSPHISFEVNIINGQLNIKKEKEDEDDRIHKYRLPKGILIAIDMDMIAGGIYYRPDDSTETEFFVNGKRATAGLKLSHINSFLKDKIIPDDKYLLISDGHVKNFFKYRDSLYFIEGFEHMGVHYGSLCRLELSRNSFKVVKVFLFDYPPRIVYVDNDKIFLVTSTKLFVIENWRLQLLIDNPFWGYLQPHSMTIDENGHAYLGMYGFYAKVDLHTKVMELFKYNK